MKLLLVALTLLSYSCNKSNSTSYIYELKEVSENIFIVDQNAACHESKYKEAFLKSNCVKEGTFYICYSEEKGNFKLKQFTTKSVCDAEIIAKKKENIGLDS